VKQITIKIDSANFSNLSEFYDEIERTMTKGLNWKIGKNLDAFNDVLRGGFGVFEGDESIRLVWKDAEKSKIDLGYEATAEYYKNLEESCHPQNKKFVHNKYLQASKGVGDTLFDVIVEIIQDSEHENITLIFA
jgi:RNAse (barnase) inhibitor barstar